MRNRKSFPSSAGIFDVLAIFLLLAQVKAQSSTDFRCRDLFPWCASQAERCGEIPSVSVLCKATCKICASEIEDSRCLDLFPWCATYADQCGKIPSLSVLCKATCKTCPSELEVCKKARCTQECEVSDDGATATCGCMDGFELLNGGYCEDINECQRNTDACPDEDVPICVNTFGDYICTVCRALDGLYNYYKSNTCCKRRDGTFDQCGSSGNSDRYHLEGEFDLRLVARWPWTAYIRTGDTVCSGALIHKRWIVTSASCVRKASPHEISVVMGPFNTSSQVRSLHEQRFSVRRFITHPEYDFPNNDIALLRLGISAVLGNFVGTVCLPNGHEPQVGGTCYTTGFEVQGSRLSAQLKEVGLSIVDASSCQTAFQNASVAINPDLHMCAGQGKDGDQGCLDNRGGPLVCQRCNSCEWYIAGIRSFGRACGSGKRFPVYTRVSQVEEWIARIIKKSIMHSTCVRPKWHAWGGWTDCTVTCGGGKRSRVRFCINGDQGDPDCLGDLTEDKNCNMQECERWGEYGEWGTCSVTCGSGTQRRSRQCLYGNIGDIGCDVGSANETRVCTVRAYCEKWDVFSPHGPCTKTCGGGLRFSMRSCIGGSPGDPGCQGNVTRAEPCNEKECP